MPRLELVDEPSSNSMLNELYQEIVNCGFGTDKPINWFTSQGLRPDIISGTWVLVKSILLSGELPPTLKQMIALVISARHNCRYCAIIHTRALESMGVPQEEIDTCVNDPNLAQLPPIHRVILNFCLKASTDPTAVTDEDFKNLRDSGLNDKEIIEVVMMVAFTKFINTWADTCGLDLE